jgi:outer membrane protein
MIRISLKVLGIICLCGLSVLVYDLAFSSKIAYVDIPKVFNSFQMKKELQQKFEQTSNARKKLLDSLSFDLQLLSQKLKDKKDDPELMDRFSRKRQELYQRKKELDEDNSSLSSQYDKQILEQMTQYIIDYGKLHHFSIIYGAEGNGGLMYADEKYNISEEVIGYINNKYQGLE